MILSCNNIQKAFGEDVVLSGCSFNIEDREKAAIVGVNGAGKTTLLRIIVGEINADGGIVTLSSGKTMGYLAQVTDISSDKTIYQEVLETKRNILDMEERIRELEHKIADNQNHESPEYKALLEAYSKTTAEYERLNGFAYKSEVAGILKGLGFSEDDYERTVMSLSGGQKTRLMLGKLLLATPDIILLDEPTNHLDMDSIMWLEDYLRNYQSAVLIVSHDRLFMDHVVTKVIEIERSKTTVFSGNYTDYAKKKEALTFAAVHAYENQQREIKHQEEVIDKLKQFNREKSIKRAESREKQLAKVEVLDKPITETRTMKISINPRLESGKDVLSVNGLSKSFGDIKLFENLNFEIKKGERVAIIGKNGTGKTTILKLIMEHNAAVRFGSNVETGYYDQEHHVLDPNKTIFDEIHDTYPYLNNSEVRTMLASFLFTEDDVFKKISLLSGGEKGRVSLAKLMLSDANLLILDEPTNHLDIMSKEILESAVSRYTGTVLYVSHDRYFINKTATRVLELEDGRLTNYLGNYDYYYEKKQQFKEAEAVKAAAQPAKTDERPGSGADGYREAKQEQARLRKLQNDLKKVEDEIALLEQEKKDIDEELMNPEIATNSFELSKLSGRQEQIDERLLELMEKWEELSQ